MKHDEWREAIASAYEPAPRTYVEAYQSFQAKTAELYSVDSKAAFQAGWMNACDALANRLVKWLDEPSGDDVQAFLGFVAELRQGDLS
jgi:hypothetical protein